MESPGILITIPACGSDVVTSGTPERRGFVSRYLAFRAVSPVGQVVRHPAYAAAAVVLQVDLQPVCRAAPDELDAYHRMDVCAERLQFVVERACIMACRIGGIEVPPEVSVESSRRANSRRMRWEQDRLCPLMTRIPSGTPAGLSLPVHSQELPGA